MPGPGGVPGLEGAWSGGCLVQGECLVQGGGGCLVLGGVPGAMRVSRPTAKAEIEGELARPPTRQLLLRAVRILLECILA